MNGHESNAASCSPVAARTRKVSGRKIFRKRKEFAPHFKRHFLKWHLRVRVLHAQPGSCWTANNYELTEAENGQEALAAVGPPAPDARACVLVHLRSLGIFLG